MAASPRTGSPHAPTILFLHGWALEHFGPAISEDLPTSIRGIRWLVHGGYRRPAGHAEHALATCPTAEASRYDGGHVPFLEEPERFDCEAAELMRHARG